MNPPMWDLGLSQNQQQQPTEHENLQVIIYKKEIFTLINPLVHIIAIKPREINPCKPYSTIIRKRPTLLTLSTWRS